MHQLLTTAGLVAGLALLTPASQAQIIVGTGADLQATIDAAPSGSVIEIHSDATFFGELIFHGSSAKDLTLKAGAGFEPKLAGTPFLPAVTIQCADRLVRLEDLTLTAGTAADAIRLADAGAAPGLVQAIEVVDCTIQGVLDGEPAGLGSGTIDLTLTGSTVEGMLLLRANAGVHAVATITDASLDDVFLVGFDAGSVAVVIEDSTLGGNGIFQYGDGAFDVDLVRCRVDGLLQALEMVGTTDPDMRLRAESCLIVGIGTVGTSGVLLQDTLGVGSRELVLRSCTVTGFATGLALPVLPQAPGSIVLTNTLLSDNDLDVSGNTTGLTATTCLAEDITLGGGSLQALAQLDADFGLLPGTPGVDAGTSTGPGSTYGPLDKDLYGNDRVVDVDLDGSPEINIGAVEVPPALFASSTIVTLGNPSGTKATTPHIGDMVSIQIDLGFQGLLGLAAIGAPLASPLPIPGWTGALLIDPASFLLYATLSGTLQLPIPVDPSLVAATVSLQGARIDAAGPGIAVQLQNRVDLVLGY